MSLYPAITSAKASALLKQKAGSCAHVLCKGFGMALFITILNVALILCGSIADSTDVVSAVIENPFIGPVTVAFLGILVTSTLLYETFKNALLTALFTSTPARRAGVILSKSKLTLNLFVASPRVQLSHGSRAPPLSHA